MNCEGEFNYYKVIERATNEIALVIYAYERACMTCAHMLLAEYFNMRNEKVTERYRIDVTPITEAEATSWVEFGIIPPIHDIDFREEPTGMHFHLDGTPGAHVAAMARQQGKVSEQAAIQRAREKHRLLSRG